MYDRRTRPVAYLALCLCLQSVAGCTDVYRSLFCERYEINLEYSIEGQLVDDAGQPVDGATILVRFVNEESDHQANATTAADGTFQAAWLWGIMGDGVSCAPDYSVAELHPMPELVRVELDVVGDEAEFAWDLVDHPIQPGDNGSITLEAGVLALQE